MTHHTASRHMLQGYITLFPRSNVMLNMHKIFTAITLLFLLAACQNTPEKNESASPVIDLPTVTAEMKDVPSTYVITGSVVSDGRIEVSSRVIGFIERLVVREGQNVSRGELLVSIDSTEIDEAIKQAKARIKACREDLNDAEADVRKYAILSPAGAVSTESFRKSKVRARIAQTELDRAMSALSAAESQKTYANITSPVEGVVVAVAKRSGELATVGAPLLTVESHEVLLFKIFVSESNLALIDANAPVTVRIDTLRNVELTGRIRGIVPSGDDVTRRYEIDIILPKVSGLTPGMFGRAEFYLYDKKALVIPREVMVRRGGLEGVFVLEGDVARFRWLRIGREFEQGVEVVAGLREGEKILRSVDASLRDGARVKGAGSAQ